MIRSHIDEGKNFFEYEPDEDYDVIVSNPPYNVKDYILERLDELNKPYAMLLPISCLQSGKRFEFLEGIQLLSFDKRISFHTLEEMSVVKAKKSTPFATAYFCKRILPKDLVLERLVKFDRSLVKESDAV